MQWPTKVWWVQPTYDIVGIAHWWVMPNLNWCDTQDSPTTWFWWDMPTNIFYSVMWYRIKYKECVNKVQCRDVYTGDMLGNNFRDRNTWACCTVWDENHCIAVNCVYSCTCTRACTWWLGDAQFGDRLWGWFGNGGLDGLLHHGDHTSNTLYSCCTLIRHEPHPLQRHKQLIY